MRKTIQIAFIILFVSSPFVQQEAWADKFVPNEYTIEFYDFPLYSCDAYGFDVLADASIHFKEMRFFDKDGNLVKFRVRWDMTTGAYKNSFDTTKFISFDPGWGGNRWIDVETGGFVQTGLYPRVTAPGWGTLILGAGRLVINGDGTVEYYKGQAADDPEDVAKLCDYLASL